MQYLVDGPDALERSQVRIINNGECELFAVRVMDVVRRWRIQEIAGQ